MQKDKTSQEIIDEQMKKLPPEVREAIVSLDYDAKLTEIFKRQKLLIDQAEILETETSLVMLGLEPISNYIANLVKNMEISKEKAGEIAIDVNENIFKKIRASLEKMDAGMIMGSVSEEINKEEEAPVTKFTNSNEEILNRDQILNEIEDPSSIQDGDRTMIMHPAKPPTNLKPEILSTNKVTTTEVEIRPSQDLELVPGQEVKDVIKTNDVPADIFKDKMTKTSIVTQQIVNALPKTKLPEVTKKRPSSGVDPYREAIN